MQNINTTNNIFAGFNCVDVICEYNKTIREILQINGIVPTAEKACETFWGLQANWWKQAIDGKFHQFGKEVFDKGLHGRTIEPGFLKSIEKTNVFISDQFDQPFSLQLYKAVHHIACVHFQGKATNTVIGRSEIDLFRTRDGWCYLNFPKSVRAKASDTNQGDSQAAVENFRSRIEKVNDCLKRMQKKYHFKYQPTIFLIERETEGRKFRAHYLLKEHLDIATENIIYSYQLAMFSLGKDTLDSLQNSADHEEVKKIYQKEALANIAVLYAELEWLHPWIDGQGRTDITILNFLLTQEGLNPALLEEPYFSTANKISDWIDYLQDGVSNWQREFRKLQAEKTPA